MKKAVIAACTAFWSLPCGAGELDDIAPSTQVYLRVPLGPASAADRKPSFGLAVKHSAQGATFMLDSRTLDTAVRNYQAEVAGGIEAKWLIVGAVALGAAVAIGTRTKSENQEQQQQNQRKQQQQQQQPQQQQQQAQHPCTC